MALALQHCNYFLGKKGVIGEWPAMVEVFYFPAFVVRKVVGINHHLEDTRQQPTHPLSSCPMKSCCCRSAFIHSRRLHQHVLSRQHMQSLEKTLQHCHWDSMQEKPQWSEASRTPEPHHRPGEQGATTETTIAHKVSIQIACIYFCVQGP